MSSKAKTESQPLEEGMYYERVFGPVQVSVIAEDPEKTKEKKIILTDVNGETVTVSDPFAINRLLHYLRRPLGLSRKEIGGLEVGDLEEAITKSIRTKPRTLKFMFDPVSGECVSVTSPLHQQISWTQVKEAVDTAILDVFGEVEKVSLNKQTATYNMETGSKEVSLWAHVDVGNNLIKGRSAVRISTRIRTEFDTSSGGSVPACLNWANVWTQLGQWFGVPVVRLGQAVKAELATVTGIAPGALAYGSHEIHIDGTTINLTMLTERLRALKEFAPEITAFIKRSISTSLSREEADDILWAYALTKRIPAYVLEQIMTAFKEETVWGFSQAVSWVRTHGALRSRKLGREDQRMTQILENIAGEVLSLAPTIANFHDEHGPITFEKLTGEKRSEASKTEAEVSVPLVQD